MDNFRKVLQTMVMPAWWHRKLRFAHRWAALLFTPLLAMILITGLILAFEGVVERHHSGSPAAQPVAVEQLEGFLQQVDRRQRARELALESGDVGVLTFSAAGQRYVEAYDLASAELIEERPSATGFFRTVRHLHKDLGLGLDWVVELATYALLVVLVIGPLLAWPYLQHTLVSWHNLLGWLTLPLVLLVSATAVLMIHEIGTPHLPPIDRDAQRPSLSEAVARAADEGGLTHVWHVERFEQVAYAVEGRSDAGPRTLIVTPDQVAEVGSYPGWIANLHQGTWAGIWSALLNAFIALILLALTVTGLLSWGLRRFRQQSGGVDIGAQVLIAHASQTGTAAKLAHESAASMRKAGIKVAESSLASLRPEQLNDFHRVLLIVSTAGDGEMPDAGQAFLNSLASADLRGCKFHLLALGDRRYRHFCAAGDMLHEALDKAGAEPLTMLTRVDGKPGREWQDWLANAAGDLGVSLGGVPEIVVDKQISLSLNRRERLDDPEDAELQEVWSLEFEAAEPLDYRPGDLLLVEPCAGEPARPYSIGSSPLEDPRLIRLTVAVTSRLDSSGQAVPGKCSGLLGRELRVGESLHAALRSHPSFRPPDDQRRPLVLIAAGCGIAPFVGFLAERAQQSQAGPVWLIFGNRKRCGDALYSQWLEQWQRDGVLRRLDQAFSRDSEDGSYATDRIRENAAELLRWIRDDGALIYVCGRRATLGEGVMAAFIALLVEQAGFTQQQAEAELEQWRADGRLRMDLIG
ncbi:assimilatory nitrate reductase large subunit [Halorhodospira halochloris]|uniref:NADPH--hemoprotein reductase n=1 Tax=Halorhodospira halochloris TaxID=1052 RepID=A0A110B6V1_HALHR|nr:PepSY domain-containing protein [Halorhodospira halochloris]BAU56908.2 assimilatory nitrate reductase large subunit [Halorhodospira halochloris]